MGASKTRDLSGELERVRQRFERWRQARRGGARIPASLWAAAARVAGRQGLHRVARALRVDCYSLKERMERQAVGPDPAGSLAAMPFLELPLLPSASPCECLLEWEDPRGAKLRIHLKSASPPDLAALGRSFWNPAS
jgi:hypothetical protein